MRKQSAALALVTISIIFFTSFGAGADSGDDAKVIVLVGGRLIDGTGTDPVDDAAVAISDGRILCAGPRTMAANNLRRFVNAGGKVALGSDYEGYSCDWDLGMPMTEIRLMAGAGMTPMQIIVAATRHGAHVCNLERQLGTLEVGKIADLFLIEGDPLADLENLQRVRLVFLLGPVPAPGKGRAASRKSAQGSDARLARRATAFSTV